MKTIVVPVDFSPASQSAARYAVEMAVYTGASLHLLHVCITPVAISEIPVSAADFDREVEDAEKEILQLKENLQHVAGSHVPVMTEIRVGNFLEQLRDFCSVIQPDAVVVSLNSRGALERFFFGSATLQAVAGLRWPLLVVPSGASFTGVRKIGLACDLKQVTDSIPAAEIKYLVRRFHAELHVVHVSETGDDVYTSRSEIDRLKGLLDEVSPVYHFMTREDIDAGITEFAEKAGLDLVIVVPRRHGLFGELFHKSHTKQLLLHTHTPVLSIHE